MKNEDVFPESAESTEGTDRRAPRRVAAHEEKASKRRGWTPERRAKFLATLRKKSRQESPKTRRARARAPEAVQEPVTAQGAGDASSHLARVYKLLADKPISALTDAEALTVLALRAQPHAA